MASRPLKTGSPADGSKYVLDAHRKIILKRKNSIPILLASVPESSLNVLQQVCEGFGLSRTPVESLLVK